MKPQDATMFAMQGGLPTYHKLKNFKLYIWVEDSNEVGRWSICRDKTISVNELAPIDKLLEARVFIMDTVKLVKRKVKKTVDRIQCDNPSLTIENC